MKTLRQVYKILYNTYCNKGLFVPDEQFSLSRKANIHAVKNTQKVWRKQFAEEITETIFNSEHLEYIVSEAEGIKEYNSVRFWYKGEELTPMNLKMIFYNSNQG